LAIENLWEAVESGFIKAYFIGASVSGISDLWRVSVGLKAGAEEGSKG